jgi:regulator of RNase E activity RraA
MKLGGIVGAAVDGPATDFSEIRRVDLPMWCRGPSPITTKILGLEGAINVPVSVGGQTVNPGDAIIADESGIVVLAPDRAKWVADKAIGMQENEIGLLERLRGGEKLPDISGATRLVEASRAA